MRVGLADPLRPMARSPFFASLRCWMPDMPDCPGSRYESDFPGVKYGIYVPPLGGICFKMAFERLPRFCPSGRFSCHPRCKPTRRNDGVTFGDQPSGWGETNAMGAFRTFGQGGVASLFSGTPWPGASFRCSHRPNLRPRNGPLVAWPRFANCSEWGCNTGGWPEPEQEQAEMRRSERNRRPNGQGNQLAGMEDSLAPRESPLPPRSLPACSFVPSGWWTDPSDSYPSDSYPHIPRDPHIPGILWMDEIHFAPLGSHAETITFLNRIIQGLSHAETITFLGVYQVIVSFRVSSLVRNGFRCRT